MKSCAHTAPSAAPPPPSSGIGAACAQAQATRSHPWCCRLDPDRGDPRRRAGWRPRSHQIHRPARARAAGGYFAGPVLSRRLSMARSCRLSRHTVRGRRGVDPGFPGLHPVAPSGRPVIAGSLSEQRVVPIPRFRPDFRSASQIQVVWSPGCRRPEPLLVDTHDVGRCAAFSSAMAACRIFVVSVACEMRYEHREGEEKRLTA